MTTKIIKVGCCGIPTRLSEYSKEFEVVELQQTFYQLPKLSTTKKWRAQTSPEFEFIIKAPQLITHPATSPTYKRFKGELKNKDNYGLFQPTKEVFKAYDELVEFAEQLNTKLILFQTPASFSQTKENINNMKKFFKRITQSFKFIWETRGKWEDKIIKGLCDELNLVHCVDPFARETVTSNKIAYFRLHGSPPGKKMYNYKYTDSDLKTLKEICSKYHEVYCLFNNIYMYEDALRFKKILIKNNGISIKT